MSWISPTGHNDPDSWWHDETLCYDGNTTSYTYSDDINPSTWSGFLEFTIAAIPCNKVRYYSLECIHLNLDLDVYWGGAWHHIYDGVCNIGGGWKEKSLGGTYTVTKMRYRYYNFEEIIWYIILREVEFYEIIYDPPTVITQSCTNITGNSATGNGNITSTGGKTVTTRGFCYMVGTTGNPTVANDKVYDTGSFGTGTYSKTIPDLSPSTNYRVRAYAINEEGIGYGATVQLTTDSPPTVTTQEVTEIESITATGNGNITATGGETVTKRGICWNITGNPTVADNKSEETGSFGIGAFTRPLTGLDPGQRYYVKAYAYNSVGYGYGAQVDFITKPAITTYNPSDIIRADPSKVTANGLIETKVENMTERGFKYGLTEADTWYVNETDSFGEGSFSLQITNLDPDTTYYIRAYMVSETWGTIFGDYIQFKTAVPYWSTKTEIKAEAIASDEDIAKVGGKKTLSISNHLIQNMGIAQNIANSYLAEYKDQKIIMVVDRPIPLPYEIGDTIWQSDLIIPYKPAAEAKIGYRPAAEAEHYYKSIGRHLMIRKINLRFNAGNFISIIELEG